MGSLNRDGSFRVTLTRPLRSGEWIYARDVCNAQNGAPVRVAPPTPAPVLSLHTVLILIMCLGMVGIWGIWRLRPRALDRR